MRHEARQVPSWLICDVGQKMKNLSMFLLLGILALPSLLVAAEPAPFSQKAKAIVVSVLGAVNKPGKHAVKPDAMVSDALSVAGGPTRFAMLSSVKLSRVEANGERIVYSINLTKKGRPPYEMSLRDGDAIFLTEPII